MWVAQLTKVVLRVHMCVKPVAWPVRGNGNEAPQLLHTGWNASVALEGALHKKTSSSKRAQLRDNNADTAMDAY